jgi:hypothetical protein
VLVTDVDREDAKTSKDHSRKKMQKNHPKMWVKHADLHNTGGSTFNKIYSTADISANFTFAIFAEMF